MSSKTYRAIGLALLLFAVAVLSHASIGSADLFSSPSSSITLDKESYQTEETVTISIELPAEHADLYLLQITAAASNYTYRGEFNDVMFFFPTEGDVYTAALVEKSTGAIFHSVEAREGCEATDDSA